jgi:lipopolysaccharide/colanic/teichoic acid biosynthesis glycosyltransferase
VNPFEDVDPSLFPVEPRVPPHNPGQVQPSARALRYANGWAKRLFDLVAGTLLSLATLPLMIVLAIGSAVSFRSWPIFVQKRLGRGGRQFRFVKLRTLPTSAPTDADKYTIRDLETTWWGRSLRSHHLDELPQCWLLITGRMSLVGPRPEMPVLARTFDPTFVAERMAVKPGITGPWQVSTAKVGLIGEAPEFDRFYLQHASPVVDARVAICTVKSFFGGAPLSIDRLCGWVGRGPDQAPTQNAQPPAAESDPPSS